MRAAHGAAPFPIVRHCKDKAVFEEYLACWGLTPDGAPLITRSSRLLPVRYEGGPAMLKIAVEAEEKQGAGLMRWWSGDGAARVLAYQDDALLLERAEGKASLAAMAHHGNDDDACRILCRAAARLHLPRNRPPPALVPLAQWFRELAPAAAKYGGILSLCSATARVLLAKPQDVATLHGDIHHGNVLDFGARGWLAIDPKGLRGERGFDYANIFSNPDPAAATAPGRLARRAAVVAAEAGLERKRLLQWVLAQAGLSAAWLLAEGATPELSLSIASEAAAELQTLF